MTYRESSGNDFITMSREVEFSEIKTTKEYIDESIKHLFDSVGSAGKDVHVAESARRIAYELQGIKYQVLSQHKFDDLLVSVIQNPRARCVDENNLCAYLMRYVEYSDARGDIITVLRSRLPYLTGEIAVRVKVELVFNDL